MLNYGSIMMSGNPESVRERPLDGYTGSGGGEMDSMGRFRVSEWSYLGYSRGLDP